jgi:nitric oxide reductase activation protein
LAKQAQDWQELTEIGNLLRGMVEELNELNDTTVPSPSPRYTGHLCLPPADLSLDQIFIPGEENLSQYLRIQAGLAPQITSLKKMFRIHLQAKSKKSWLRGLDEGDSLDKERLYLIPTGNNSVFKTKHTRNIIDTAVELMIDLSGSIREDLVKASAIVLAEALSTIPKIKLDICGFKTNGESSGNFSGNTGRQEGMDILVFKNFDEPYTKSRARLGGIKTSGGTPLGDAYGKALERILPRSEPRRIIFLITDGEPAFIKGKYHNDYILMSHIFKRCQQIGVETLGLGIGRNAQSLDKLKLYVDNYSRIESINTLPQTLMQTLRGVVR